MSEISSWDWAILAAIFAVIEMMTLSAMFLLFTAAAIIMAVVVAVMPDLQINHQLFLFSALMISSFAYWMKFSRGWGAKTDAPMLNNRLNQLIGRQVTLKASVIDGRGKVMLDDAPWVITGEDCEAGEKIEITGSEETMLTFDILPPLK